MIALIIGSLLPAAVLLGWYGHKAFLRIQVWGERLNEQDAIFQAVAPEEELEQPFLVTQQAVPQSPSRPDPVLVR